MKVLTDRQLREAFWDDLNHSDGSLEALNQKLWEKRKMLAFRSK